MKTKRRSTILAAGGALVTVAALAVTGSPNDARAARVGQGCGRVAAVKAWQGEFWLSFSATATGTAPGEGDTHTITLKRNAENVPLRLRRTIVGRLSPATTVVLAYDKVVRGGSFAIQDSLQTSHDGLVGAVAGTHRPTSMTALLALVPRTCTFKLQVSVTAQGTYTGQPTFDPGTTTVTAMARSHLEHIPASLKLGGHSDTVPAQQTGCAGVDAVEALAAENGCYQFVGGWTNDFATLESCHSVVAVGCGAPDAPMGEAHFAWNLSPIIK